MFNSKKYWNDRHIKTRRTSVTRYNQLSIFKAKIINNFIGSNNIKSIIDYGSGDGNQVKLINTENRLYTGIDVSSFIISKCNMIFKDDPTKTFIHTDDMDHPDHELDAELVLSSGVLYHLVEDDVYEQYMNRLFRMSNKYVIIYAPNLYHNEAIHVNNREFIEYIFDKFKNFHLIDRIQGEIGCPFYIFQKVTTYTPVISENILQITKCDPVRPDVVLRIKEILDGYKYHWYSDETFYTYIQENQLEEFPDIIQKIKGLTKGQHKADIFRYYWLYLNGGIFMDDDLMIENKIDFKHNTFVTVKSYHKNKNLMFNGFIACSKFNPIMYKALKRCYVTDNLDLTKDYHLFCVQLYHIYQQLKTDQNTFILQEKRHSSFKEGVRSYYKDMHMLSHWCYSKKVELNNSVNKHILNRKMPVYISLTSIFKSQDRLLQTLQSIVTQTKKPDKIYVHLSEEPYMLDHGFKDQAITNTELLDFLNDNSIIDVKWVKNTGSYRKLLPLLKDKWEEDCIIITIDDDSIYDERLIQNLVDDYDKHKCVVGYRGFTPKHENIEKFVYKVVGKRQALSLRNFLTGKGGILYKPAFFHQTGNLIFNDDIYLDTCKTHDDIWFYLIRILNNIQCYVGDKKWESKDISSDGLFVHYNRKKHGNTNAVTNTVTKLKELDYCFDRAK